MEILNAFNINACARRAGEECSAMKQPSDVHENMDDHYPSTSVHRQPRP